MVPWWYLVSVPDSNDAISVLTAARKKGTNGRVLTLPFVPFNSATVPGLALASAYKDHPRTYLSRVDSA